ncbi:hypothetical protein BpHYR1_017072 [Brachionus plicatilis]|uniref:Uncharacterized protein n=1 Tax=Brachionus plicatilis TaxID=10195 RepID=A0A3M7RQ58_BRAPC|nr:hypothetical protein BpHYR1_017072 [Brachionus plicatilis]
MDTANLVYNWTVCWHKSYIQTHNDWISWRPLSKFGIAKSHYWLSHSRIHYSTTNNSYGINWKTLTVNITKDSKQKNCQFQHDENLKKT